MNCQIYRSDKKAGTYLYLHDDKSFEDLPDGLVKILGHCEKVMELDLSKREYLASEDINLVKSNLSEQGFHLQVPPQLINGLVDYKTSG
ncbi:MAG: YcgL domain-containing protein [Proteobacteria bacterium]|nr:YcgL domain-containing protein [Pseudomonadota bacterium]